ncbi:hypothetical protein GCM10009616_40610 [Microlunatus lacustris]
MTLRRSLPYSEGMVVARRRVAELWDQVVGPGASRFENAGTLGSGLLGGALAPLLDAQRSGPGRDRPAELALPLLAIDLWGGAWCNNTPTAARWYHREGRGRIQHLVFTAAHLHPFVVAWLDRRSPLHRSRLTWAISHYSYLQVATVLIASQRRRTQRVTAVAATLGGILLDRLLGPSDRAPWFAPVYYVKLLTGHVGGAAALRVDPLLDRE